MGKSRPGLESTLVREGSKAISLSIKTRFETVAFPSSPFLAVSSSIPMKLGISFLSYSKTVKQSTQYWAGVVKLARRQLAMPIQAPAFILSRKTKIAPLCPILWDAPLERLSVQKLSSLTQECYFPKRRRRVKQVRSVQFSLSILYLSWNPIMGYLPLSKQRAYSLTTRKGISPTIYNSRCEKSASSPSTRFIPLLIP